MIKVKVDLVDEVISIELHENTPVRYKVGKRLVARFLEDVKLSQDEFEVFYKDLWCLAKLDTESTYIATIKIKAEHYDDACTKLKQNLPTSYTVINVEKEKDPYIKYNIS